jgi:hypothetical protein
MPEITLAIAEEYIWALLERFKTCNHSSEVSLRSQLERDVIFYGSRQQRSNGKIYKRELLKQVGTNSPETLKLILDDLREKKYIEDVKGDYEEFKLNGFLVKAVESSKSTKSCFYGEHSYYRLDQTLPNLPQFGNDVGQKLVDMINQDEDNGHTGRAAQFIAHILRDVVGLTPHEPLSEDPRFICFKDTEGKDQLVLCVVCSSETLTDGVFKDLFFGLHETQGKYPKIKTLFICPSINGKQAEKINKEDDLFCMWDLSLVAFLHQLAFRVNDKIRASQVFGQIFEHTESNDYCYMECHALALLEKLLG